MTATRRVPRPFLVCVATIATQQWASGFLAGNDDDDDQRQDAEEQPQESPPDRVSPLHGGHDAADDGGDDAADRDEDALDAAQDETCCLDVVWAASTTVCNIATSSLCTGSCRRITPCAV